MSVIHSSQHALGDNGAPDRLRYRFCIPRSSIKMKKLIRPADRGFCDRVSTRPRVRAVRFPGHGALMGKHRGTMICLFSCSCEGHTQARGGRVLCLLPPEHAGSTSIPKRGDCTHAASKNLKYRGIFLTL